MISTDSLELADIKFLLGTLKRRKEYLEAVCFYIFLKRCLMFLALMKIFESRFKESQKRWFRRVV